MGKVVAQAITSLDGYVAKQDNTIGRLFDWLQNGEVARSRLRRATSPSTSTQRASSAGRAGPLRSVRWSAAVSCSR
jgi:hypothetical protein